MNWLLMGGLSLATVIATCAALLRRRRRQEQRPEPIVQRYVYTTPKTYDQDKAVTAARAARLRSARGRPWKKATTKQPAQVVSISRRKRA